MKSGLFASIVHIPQHPAPYPLELAERLIRMFSFAGDTVLDPFTGTGTTNLAAALWGRHSIGLDVDKQYIDFAYHRITKETRGLCRSTYVTVGQKAALE